MQTAQTFELTVQTFAQKREIHIVHSSFSRKIHYVNVPFNWKGAKNLYTKFYFSFYVSFALSLIL